MVSMLRKPVPRLRRSQFMHTLPTALPWANLPVRLRRVEYGDEGRGRGTLERKAVLGSGSGSVLKKLFTHYGMNEKCTPHKHAAP